jgi:ribosomal protein L37E
MIELVLKVVWQRSSTVYECRRCGTTVSPRTKVCPQCGYEEIVEYECR